MAHLAIYIEFHKIIEKKNAKEPLHSLINPPANKDLAELEDLTTEEEKFDKDDETLKKNNLNM